MDETKAASQKLTSRVTWSALGVLLLTCVHHAYGAYIYHTEWRLHVVFVSALAAAAIKISESGVQRRRSASDRGLSFWVFTSVTMLIPVLTIGLFEGGYNHALKNALYFSGCSMHVMRQLFPAPTYEMPNDAFFEVTGVMQLVAGTVAGSYLYRFFEEQKRGANPEMSHAHTA